MSLPVVREIGLVDSSITRDVNQSVGEIMECNRIIHSFSSSEGFVSSEYLGKELMLSGVLYGKII